MPPNSSEHRGPGLPGSFDRAEALDRLAEDRFDVLVIGGGITGAGVALDAASRGLRTALVERDDFATGTSSKSSKLVHGGLRYLAQREVRLVYESLHERQRLLDNAPHLVSPLPFLIPLFGRNGVVQKNVARAYSVALWLYDVTGGWRIGKRHRRVSRSEALTHLPTLRADRLVAGFYYYDAWADDARLTLAVMRTAALDHGAVACNYVGVESLVRDSRGKVSGARVVPRIPGVADPHDAFEVSASVIVNATGVWADDVRSLDEGVHPHSLRPAKGVHVTLPRSKLPADIAAVIPVPRDKRSIFVVPWADGDDVYVGTTDTAWDGPLEDPVCLPDDVDYLLEALNISVGEPVTREDITGVWAGLRPLLAPSGGHHMSERTADLSRRHQVRRSEGNVVTVTGGKLTTYRRMAEDTVDEVVRVLGAAVPTGVKSCRTARLSIRGVEGLAGMLEPGAARAHGLDGEVFTALVRRHGGETPAVLELASGRPELLEPLVPGLPQLRVEALWAAREEMAQTIADVLSRRTRASLRRAEAAAETAEEVGALLAGEWGRDRREVAEEARAFAEETRDARPSRARLTPDADVAALAGRRADTVSRPTPPIEVDARPGAVRQGLASPRVAVDDALVERLRSVCAEVDVGEASLVDASRDWWPITLEWATRGEVPALPAVVAKPADAGQVAAVLAACNDARVPLTPTAGRSGVCGSSVPAFGGVALDMCAMAGITDLDSTSLLVRVLPGTFGPDLEEALQTQQTTLGHWPQSMDISTVGGWLACRGAGQYSTRYGKIEDMVAGLEVVLADGRTISTGGTGPRAAAGPDLSQLFVGSEGTLGVITSALFRVHPNPEAQARRAYGFSSFEEGLDACRRVMRRGATPAVLRLYDPVESARNFSVDDLCVLVVLDEADPAILEATIAVVDGECSGTSSKLDDGLVDRWLTHRNDVSALAPLYKAGIVVDTIEISARWSALDSIYRDSVHALHGIDGTLAASAHQSHSYTDGACLYFTFGGRMPDDSAATSKSAQSAARAAWAQRYYADAWQVVMDVVISEGGAISHHHGIGINRARFMGRALGGALQVLDSVKSALDPRGILNPGKLGLSSPFGEIHWP